MAIARGVHAGALCELDSLVGVGDVVQTVAACAVSVFHAAEDADFTFDGDAALVGEVDNALGDFHILFKAGGGLAVGLERAIHHDGGEAELDGGLAGLKAVAVILMHGNRNLGVELGSGEHEVVEVAVLSILAGAAGGLDDDRRLGLLGGFHDGLDLLHVVDVESSDAVTALGGLVEQLAHRYKRHAVLLKVCPNRTRRAHEC